ncbi:MAG: anaerobic ribonucleoside-triphosphate reductase activating protein [bacterium]
MSDGLPPIKGFLPTSFIEWEGQISCALFLPGCSFRCPFCHASDLVLRGQELEDVPFESVAAHLDRNEGWIDGVVVSGGEATIHPRLEALLRALRDHAMAVKLDTNGSRPRVLGRLVRDRRVDFVAMDVKAPNAEGYAAAAGTEVDFAAIEASISLLRESGIPHEFRTTVVPGLHGLDEVLGIARLLGGQERLVLQQFAPLNCLDPSYNDRRPLTRDQLRHMAAAAGQLLARCTVRGDPAPAGAPS